MMLQGFLLGVISLASVVAGLFFLKFWRTTRDSFFLLFAASFIIEGFNRAALLLLARPNDGNPSIFLVRLFTYLLILAAILKKNYGRRG